MILLRLDLKWFAVVIVKVFKSFCAQNYVDLHHNLSRLVVNLHPLLFRLVVDLHHSIYCFVADYRLGCEAHHQ